MYVKPMVFLNGVVLRYYVIPYMYDSQYRLSLNHWGVASYRAPIFICIGLMYKSLSTPLLMIIYISVIWIAVYLAVGIPIDILMFRYKHEY